jgi:hypothetical protein
MAQSSSRTRLAMLAVVLLLAANIVVPLLWGDVYPFTSAPMFRDSPVQFCNYHIYDPGSRELPAADWLLQRVYDGNPVGYGVGLRPPSVLEQQFGVIHDEATVRAHVQSQFATMGNDAYEYVDVVQETIGHVDSAQLGIVRTERWRIVRP